MVTYWGALLQSQTYNPLAAWAVKARALGIPPYPLLSSRQTQTGFCVPDTVIHLSAKAVLCCPMDPSLWGSTGLPTQPRHRAAPGCWA